MVFQMGFVLFELKTVSQAYTSIVADDFAAFVGLPVEEAVKGTLYQLLRFLQMVRAISGGK